MAFKRAHWVVLDLLILATLASTPMWVHSSRYCVQCGTTILLEDNPQVPATEVEKMGEGLSSHGMDLEDSARQIPTGPDPLHHNRHPVGP